MREYRGLAVAIAMLIVVFAMTLGALLVVLSWIGITGYSIFKAFADGSGVPNAKGIVIGMAILVAVLVLVLAVGIRFIGKGMEPPKRAERADALVPFAVDEP